MKNPRFVAGSIIGLMLLFCGFNVYHYYGVVGATKKNGYGCICHDFTPDPATRVWLTGPDSVSPGEQALFRIHIARDSALAGGFNVATFFGVLEVADSLGTQIMSEELTHTTPKLANGRDTISWDFFYRAPATANILDTIYSAGNVVDTSFDPTGDTWNFGDDYYVVVGGPNTIRSIPVTHSFYLLQNFPNPFNPTTVIRFLIPERSQVRVEVMDLAGRVVGEIFNEFVNEGMHEVVFSGDGLSSGLYLYKVTSQTDVESVRIGKMLLVR
jgi:hypothetical protein